MTAVVILLSASGTIYAAPLASQSDVRLCYNSEFGFTVAERDGENNTIVRTFKRENNTPILAVSHASENLGLSEAKTAETKALLAALGMKEDFISQLSAESLQQYSTSTQIISTVSYIKTDAEGNSVNVTKEEAEEATARVGDLILPPHEYNDPPGGGNSYGDSLQDTYMELVFLITYLGQGKYKFSVDATWLLTPSYRFTDSLGACAQNFAIENNARSGWYSYDGQGMSGYDYFERSYKVTFSEDDFQNASKDNWDGSGVKIPLAVDIPSSASNPLLDYVYYTNHMMHYEYVGTIHQYTQETHFNTTATYEHTKVMILPEVSLGISLIGPEVSIGLDTSALILKDTRTVEIDSSIHYLPD